MYYNMLKKLIQLTLMRLKWRRNNSHNNTFLANTYVIDTKRIKVGNATYGSLNVVMNSEDGELVIGNYCSIANDVCFIVGGDHDTSLFSTYPFKVMILQEKKYEALSKGDIIIDDDVWLGQKATILSGVHIGQGAVVATGAVVTKDVPPYAIVGGVPAQVIKYRFEQEIIDKLCQYDFGTLCYDLIKNNTDILYEKVTIDNIDEILIKL